MDSSKAIWVYLTSDERGQIFIRRSDTTITHQYYMSQLNNIHIYIYANPRGQCQRLTKVAAPRTHSICFVTTEVPQIVNLSHRHVKSCTTRCHTCTLGKIAEVGSRCQCVGMAVEPWCLCNGPENVNTRLRIIKFCRSSSQIRTFRPQSYEHDDEKSSRRIILSRTINPPNILYNPRTENHLRHLIKNGHPKRSIQHKMHVSFIQTIFCRAFRHSSHLGT